MWRRSAKRDISVPASARRLHLACRLQSYKMGSYQAAEFYGLKNYGAIGAGYRADIVFLDDLEQVRPLDVMKDGRILTEEDYAKRFIPFRFRMSCFIPFMWERSPKEKSGFPVMEKRM